MIKITIEIDEKITGAVTKKLLDMSPLSVEVAQEIPPNFSFEIKIVPNSKLTLINIDGTKVEGHTLAQFANAAVDGLIKGSVFVPLVTNRIFLVIDAVGEPGLQLQLMSFKYREKELVKKTMPFTIKSNRRGQLTIEPVEISNVLS